MAPDLRVLEVLSRHGVPFVVIGVDLFNYVPRFPEEPVSAVWETGVELDGIRFASLEWLRHMKRAAYRAAASTDVRQSPLIQFGNVNRAALTLQPAPRGRTACSARKLSNSIAA